MTVPINQFEAANTLAAIQNLSKSALQKAALENRSVNFIAAKNFKVGTQTTSVFLVVDHANNEFLEAVKRKGGSLVVVSYGEASVKAVNVKNQMLTRVIVESAHGPLSANIISTIIKPAMGNDAKYEGTTKERQQAEEAHLAAEQAQRPKPNAPGMAQQSHQQAHQEGKQDHEAQLTPQMIEAMAKVSLHSAEFGKFNQNFSAFIKKYGLKKEGVDAGKLPTQMWEKLFEGLSKSGYVKEHIPKAANGDYVVGMEGPQGRVVREALLERAMRGMQPFIDHAGRYMDQIIQRAASGSTYAFWSGRGANEASRAAAGVTLNLGVGAFFDAYEGELINFPKLTSTEDLPLWAALSEMYALKAAESVDKFEFWGFVGPTATRDQSVLNKIEVPSFFEALNARQSARPHVTWFVVDCAFTPDATGGDTFQGQKGKWAWTKQESERFNTRESAMGRLVQRYER